MVAKLTRASLTLKVTVPPSPAGQVMVLVPSPLLTTCRTGLGTVAAVGAICTAGHERRSAILALNLVPPSTSVTVHDFPFDTVAAPPSAPHLIVSVPSALVVTVQEVPAWPALHCRPCMPPQEPLRRVSDIPVQCLPSCSGSLSV